MAIDLRDEEVDTVPTSGSTNPIDSNAVFVGLASKENTLPSMVGNSLKVLRVNAGETGKEWATVSGGNPLEGTNYLSVLAQGTPAENGQAVRNAYTFAQSMTPNGNALSSANRVTILLAPGLYTFNEAVDGQFIISSSFIDFESLSGATDVYFSSINVVSNTAIPFQISNIILSGIDTTKNNYYSHGAFAVSSTGDPSENIYIKDCVGGDYSFSSFSSGINANSSYNNCKARNYSFGSTGDGIMSPSGIIGIPSAFLGFINFGTFKNCNANNYSFCSNSIPVGGCNNYGLIENCTGNNNCFNYALNGTTINSGEIINCKASFNSFCSITGGTTGNQAINSGVIFNCRAFENSFCNYSGSWISSSGANNYGTINQCVATSGSCFVVNTTPRNGGNYGKILNCSALGTTASFMGSNGQNFGFISNCIASSNAFCNDSAADINEDILRCTLVNDTFTVGVTGGGRVVLGIDTTGVVNY